MRKLLSFAAVGLGVVGLFLSIALIGLGWRTAARAVDRIDRVAVRLDNNLAEADDRLARIEAGVGTIRSEIIEIRGAEEGIVAENPELPRVRAEIEQLLDRLVPPLDRLERTADSLQALAAGLRAAADIVDQLSDDPEVTTRLRNAADTIDRAVEVLNIPQAKIDALKSAKGVQLTQGLVDLVRKAIAGSELLAEGLAATRQASALARKQTAEYRDVVVYRIYAAAVANTLIWLWVGVGQMCLIGWGRRRISKRFHENAGLVKV